MGERLVVQFARGARRNDNAPNFQERTAPRPRRTAFRMSITSLPAETSWQVSISPSQGLELQHYMRTMAFIDPTDVPPHLRSVSHLTGTMPRVFQPGPSCHVLRCSCTAPLLPTHSFRHSTL